MTLEFSIHNTIEGSTTYHPRKFYVYVLVDPFTFVPIYVGKGTGSRYLNHWRRRFEVFSSSGRVNPKNRHLRSMKAEPRYFIQDNLDQKDSFALETRYLRGLENYYKVKLTNLIYKTGDSLNVSREVLASLS